MKILDIDDSGYFKGEFDYGENMTVSNNRTIEFKQLMDGVYTFLGRLDFKIYSKKIRHPYKISENRQYVGKLYLVDRLDYQFEKYDFETYMYAEYDVVHYREMKALKFMYVKSTRENFKLPKEFILNREMGLSFDPSIGVKTTALQGDRILRF